jgi:flagellar motility protein MotE (MotC chaperone)
MTALLRRFALTIALALLALSLLARIVSASFAVGGPSGTNSGDDEAGALLCPPTVEVTEMLTRIATRNGELDARADALALREQDLRLTAEEVRAAIADLEAARAALEARMASSDAASETDVARLTAVYEGMKPKDAAALFVAMEPSFAAGFLSRMRPEAAAAILSGIPSDVAYALSVVMAGRNADAARAER